MDDCMARLMRLLISTKQDHTRRPRCSMGLLWAEAKSPAGSVISPLGETDLADVDGYHQHFQDRPASRTRVYARRLVGR